MRSSPRLFSPRTLPDPALICPSCNTEAGDVSRFCPSCGATIVRALEADDFIGKIVARKYRVEQMLGEGGMGKVYKANQVALDKPVVLKVLRQSLLSDERTVARFHREAKAASRLNHPNSISVLDFGQSEEGSLYIAMEFVAGKDLHQVLSKEWPLPEARLVRIISQVLSALSDAHGAGVVHRDLKPENIMIEQRRGEPDFVKVLDFGIAKIQDSTGEEGPALTRAGFVCGTPEYMSPEQARGAQVDHRSDLYAVGVILYQLTTGMLPFDSDSAVGFATKHLTEEPPLPSRRRPDCKVSQGMERLIMRALAKDPNDRPQTADEFKADLNSLDKDRRSANAARRGVSSPVLQPLPRKVTPTDSTGGQQNEQTWPGQGEVPDQTVRAFPDQMERAQRVLRQGQQAGASGAKSRATDTGVTPVPADKSLKVLKGATVGLVVISLGFAGYFFWQVNQDAPPAGTEVAGNGATPAPVADRRPLYEQDVAGANRDASFAERLEREGDDAHLRGELTVAADKYQQAFAKDPRPTLSLKLGEVFYQANKVQEARGWWQRHLKDQTTTKARRYILEAMPDLG